MIKKHFLLIGLFLSSIATVNAQDQLIKNFVHKEIFTPPSLGIREKRKVVKRTSNRLNPSHIFSSSLLYFYQNIISEQLQTSCSYQISCSQHMKLGISHHGWFKGVLLGLNQYTNCVPRNYEYHTEQQVNQDMKIINAFSHE
jgi:putative component of membrane protein insertase Oxa1/YidC/SpoIIIJ protein YidD